MLGIIEQQRASGDYTFIIGIGNYSHFTVIHKKKKD
jgi:hypothetical protein